MEREDVITITRCRNGFSVQFYEPYVVGDGGRECCEVFETEDLGDFATPLMSVVYSMVTHWGLFLDSREARLAMTIEQGDQ